MNDRPDRDLVWVREERPVWDADKERIIGGAPDGAFVVPFRKGDHLPGEWWAARDAGPGGGIVAYGRLDTAWGGEAEILLAVDPSAQQCGVGSFVLDQLEAEASRRGITYVHNTIREHAQRDYVHDWLVVRGFRGPVDSDLRKRIPGTAARSRDAGAVLALEPVADARAPGHERQGGQVAVKRHEY